MKKCIMISLLLLLALLIVACSANPSATKADSTQGATAADTKADTQTTGSTPDTEPMRYALRTTSSTDDYGVAGSYTQINDRFEAGETVQLEASVNSGYHFVGWFVGQRCISTEREYTFTTGQTDTIIEAKYTYYTVETSSYTDDYEKAGTYTQMKHTKVSPGEQVTVEASVNPGYNFEGWFINDICVSSDTSYSFTMKEQNVPLEARWSYYTVSTWSWSDDSGVAGAYSKLDAHKVSVGETVTVSASVNKGYNFEGWYIGGTLICTDREYSFVMKERNVELEALYSCYTLTVECWDDDEGMAGTYPQIQNERISAGEIVQLTATVKDGYNFEGWYIGDVCVCKDLTYEFVMEKADKTVRADYSWYRLDVIGLNAYWETDPYLDSEGAYTKYEQQKVSAGQTVTLIATPPEGYTFVGWYIGYTCVSTELEFTYTMTKEDVCIRAIFTYYIVHIEGYLVTDFWAWDSYSWVELEDNMGSYTRYSEQKVRVGDTVTLTAVAKKGYRFVGWKRANSTVLVSTDATYTFVMGAEDCYLEAMFVEDDFEGL